MSPLRGVRQPVRMSNAALLLVPRLAARIETNMVEFWFHLSGSAPMPTTLTLKNIPDAVRAAQCFRRIAPAQPEQRGDRVPGNRVTAGQDRSE